MTWLPANWGYDPAKQRGSPDQALPRLTVRPFRPCGGASGRPIRPDRPAKADPPPEQGQGPFDNRKSMHRIIAALALSPPVAPALTDTGNTTRTCATRPVHDTKADQARGGAGSAWIRATLSDRPACFKSAEPNQDFALRRRCRAPGTPGPARSRTPVAGSGTSVGSCTISTW
jgi:hypothetical protein